MRLLIITQTVDTDDRNLGFFASWLREFAHRCDSVTVICLRRGASSLPPNVSVFSLGTESGASRPVRFFRYQKLLLQHLAHTDGVFFHMSPEFVLAAHFLPALFRKKTLLWYTHKEVSWRLRLAVQFVDRIFTASKESCRLQSKKVEVVGHGIDTELFRQVPEDTKRLRMITVGRIAPVKGLRTLILGFLAFKEHAPEAELSIIGDPITEIDRRYANALKRDFAGRVEFHAGLPHGSAFAQHQASIFLHASATGSIDKAVLEALASGLFVITSSEAFSPAIPGVFTFKKGDPADLAQTILRAVGEMGRYNEAGREWVKTHHELRNLISRIVSFYE